MTTTGRMTTTEEVLAKASTLGEAVRLLREERRLTLRELAKRAGLSAPFLSDLEHNRRSTDRLAELAAALEVPVEALKKFDTRLSTELKDWMISQPALSAALDEYRRSGKSVDTLLQALRASTSKSGRDRR